MYIQKIGTDLSYPPNGNAPPFSRKVVVTRLPYIENEKERHHGNRTSIKLKYPSPLVKCKNKFPIRVVRSRSAAHCNMCLHEHAESAKDVYLASPYMDNLSFRNDNTNRGNFLLTSNPIRRYRKIPMHRRNFTVPLDTIRTNNEKSRNDVWKVYNTEGYPYVYDPYADRYFIRTKAYSFGKETYEDILLREYHQLTDERPNSTLSSLRIDGIRREPLPPIKSEAGYNRAFLTKVDEDNNLTDVERLEIFARVKPDIKKLQPGYRIKRTFSRNPDHFNDYTYRNTSQSYLRRNDQNANNSSSVKKRSNDNENDPSSKPTNDDGDDVVDGNDDDDENERLQSAIMSPPESSIDPNFIDEYRSILNQTSENFLYATDDPEITVDDDEKDSRLLSSSLGSATQNIDTADILLGEHDQNNVDETEQKDGIDDIAHQQSQHSEISDLQANLDGDSDGTSKENTQLVIEDVSSTQQDGNLQSFFTDIMKIVKEDDQKANIQKKELVTKKVESTPEETQNPIEITEVVTLDQSKEDVESESHLNEDIDNEDEDDDGDDDGDGDDDTEPVVNEDDKVAIEVPPIPKMTFEYSKYERISSDKKNTNLFSQKEKTKKTLKKPPTQPMHFDKRFEEYKAKRRASQTDENIDDEGTMLDFASKYCILSLEQLNRYERVFNEFSTTGNDLEWNEDQDNDDEDWRNELSDENLTFLKEYEEICYEVDANNERITQIDAKIIKLEEELKETQVQFITAESAASQTECLQKQTKMMSRLQNLEKQYTENIDKQKEAKHIQKDLKEFLTSQEDLPEGLLNQIKQNKDTFRRRFLKRKSSFVQTNYLHDVLRKLNINFRSRDISFIERLLELPDKHPQLNFKMFSIVAAMTEKITGLDSSMRLYLDQMDLNSMERRLQKCKELYELINEQYKKKDYRLDMDKSAENLFSELLAGGMNEEEMKSITEKLVHNGRVDFLDFAMYIPLFLKIHETILKSPFS